MKKGALIIAMILLIIACKSDDSSETSVALQSTLVDFIFTQNFDGDPIRNSDFDQVKYTNANGELLSISKLNYLISDITFTNENGLAFTDEDYNFIDVRNQTNLAFTPQVQLPEGTYTVSFTYGFNNQDNLSGIYTDLNSVDGGWGVPEMLGGGYHFMRLEGKYINNTSEEVGYQFHNIRANDRSTTPITLQDTSIQVNLGQIEVRSGIIVEVQMNVAEWFKNPNQWDLNILFESLMGNFDAQILMNENGQNVFSLGEIIIN